MKSLMRYQAGPVTTKMWLQQMAHAEEQMRQRLEQARKEGHEVIGDTVIMKGADACTNTTQS